MRSIFIILLAVCMIGIAFGAQTKINASTQINWTGDIGSQIHGVTNGTAAQDAATTSQTIEAIGITVGPASDGILYSYYTDGTNDDVQIREAVNKLHDAGKGGRVTVMPGNYNMSAQIVIPPGIELCGLNEPAQYTGHVPNLTRNEVARFFITDTTDEAIQLLDSGSGIYNIQFIYPNQHTSEEPIFYPATVEISQYGMFNHVEHCNFVNSYIAINQTSGACKATIQHNNGYPIYIGYQVDNSYDINLVNDNHWNPNAAYSMGFCPTGNLSYWIMNNSMAYKIGRSDGLRLTNNFCYYYAYGVYVFNYNSRIYITGNYVDNIQKYGIFMTGCDLSKVMISDNVIDTINNSIYLNTDANLTLSNIYNNQIQSTHGNGIDILPFPPNVAASNRIIGNDIDIGDNVDVRIGIKAYGNANVINNNMILGLTLQTIGVNFGGNGITVNSNVFSYIQNAAISPDLTATQYTCIGNSGYHTGGFPADANTTTIQCVHNVNSAY